MDRYNQTVTTGVLVYPANSGQQLAPGTTWPVLTSTTTVANLAQQLNRQSRPTVTINLPQQIQQQRESTEPVISAPIQMNRLRSTTHALAKLSKLDSMPSNERRKLGCGFFDRAIQTLSQRSHSDDPLSLLYSGGWLLSKGTMVGHALALHKLIELREQNQQYGHDLDKMLLIGLQGLTFLRSEWSSDCLITNLMLSHPAKSSQISSIREKILKALETKASLGHEGAREGLVRLARSQNLTATKSTQLSHTPFREADLNEVVQALFQLDAEV